GGFELQAELFLECGEQIRRRRGIVGRRRRRRSGPETAELKLIGRPGQNEIPSSGESRLIDYRPVQNGALHDAGKVRHGGVPGGQISKSPEEQAGKTVRIAFALRQLRAILAHRNSVDRQLFLVAMKS